MQLTGPAGVMALTQSEVRLLDALDKAPDAILERWQAAVTLGMDMKIPNFSSLEVRIGTLRKKLHQCGMPLPCIKAVRKVGYKLCGLLEFRSGR